MDLICRNGKNMSQEKMDIKCLFSFKCTFLTAPPLTYSFLLFSFRNNQPVIPLSYREKFGAKKRKMCAKLLKLVTQWVSVYSLLKGKFGAVKWQKNLGFQKEFTKALTKFYFFKSLLSYIDQKNYQNCRWINRATLWKRFETDALQPLLCK